MDNVDANGTINNNNNNEPKSLDEMMFKSKDATSSSKSQTSKNFTPITSYKPQGNFVYNDELLNTLENKFK